MAINLIILSPFSSVFFSVISFVGILFLITLGRLYETGFPGFTETIHSPSNPKAIAHSCYLASVIYVVLLVFSIFQVFLHSRKNQNAVRL